MKSDWLIISELVTALSVKHVMNYGSPSLLCESGAESPELSRIFHIQLVAWSHDADLLDQEELKKNLHYSLHCPSSHHLSSYGTPAMWKPQINASHAALTCTEAAWLHLLQNTEQETALTPEHVSSSSAVRKTEKNRRGSCEDAKNPEKRTAR